MSESSKNVPKIRFPGFTGDWEQREFAEMFDLSISNNTLSRSALNHQEGKIKNIHYGDVLIKYDSFVDITNDEVPYIINGIIDDYKSQLLQNGDIIIADTAEDETTGKAVEIANIHNNDVVSGLHTIVCRPQIKMASFYLGYYMNSNVYHRQLLPLMQGIKVLSISKRNLLNTVIKYPSIYAEQANIGNFFKQIDSLIGLHQRRLNHLKDEKNSSFQKMFPQDGESFPELRFPEFSDAWEWQELGKVGKTFTGLSGKTKEDFGHGKAKFVTYLNVFGNPIAHPNGTDSVEIDDKQNQVQYGDVFFTTSSETPEEVGMSSVWLENTTNIYLNSFCFGYRPTVEFDVYYLGFMLRSPSIRKRFMLLAQGISRYNISKVKVMDMKIPVPDLSEQQKIGAFFKNLDDFIALQKRKLKHMQKLKKALLQSMFV